MSTDPSGVEPAEEEDARPSEWESAFLTIVLFGGLVVFAVGCMTFLW
ncbi:MAG TPA: hypothetical protein VK053_17030 [Jiangellaceae bacterium]|nr:hypothetical protein [Jiangellaceae bacterium]